MSYVKENLLPNEKILFTVKINPAVFIPSFVMCLFSVVPILMFLSMRQNEGGVITFHPFAGILLCVSGMVFLAATILALGTLIVMLTTEFAVTNRRVIAKRGFIRRHTLEIFLHKIESVSVNQNILQRLFNFGSVTLIGTGGTQESFRAIVDPVGVRRKINQVIEKYSQQPNVQKEI